MEKKKIVVVGGNAAGPAAAAKAKRVNPDAEVTMFEAGSFISTGSCELPYVLSGHIDNYKNIVFFTDASFFKIKGVKVYSRHFVEDIDRRGKNVIVRNLETDEIKSFDYDSLILTTGTKKVDIPGISTLHENVFNLKTVGDYLQIKEYIEKNAVQSVLIVGASFIGLEAAESFLELKKKATLIDIADLPMPAADEEIQTLIAETLDKNNIEFIGGKRDVEYISEDNRITKVKIDGRVLQFDLILVSVGFKPNLDLAEKIGLEKGITGSLKVNKKQQTSDPNIFAAGDNSEVVNFITNRPDYIPLAPFAQKNGHIAGANAAGANEFSVPAVKNAAVKILDNALVTVGLSEKEAKKNNFNYFTVSKIGFSLIKVMPESQKIFGKIIVEKETKRILGASFYGAKEAAGYGDLIASLIIQKSDARILSKISYNYTPPISPFINLLSMLGRKIEEIL
ncbi:MAG: FAD-dependent oxidoreductase [Chlorobi bacterium]|nr:FAD-dependent oxidoreductase [Chlorobiota bacterium]